MHVPFSLVGFEARMHILFNDNQILIEESPPLNKDVAYLSLEWRTNWR